VSLSTEYPVGISRTSVGDKGRFEGLAGLLLHPDVPDQDLIDLGAEVGFTVADLNRALASWWGSYQALRYGESVAVATSKVAATLRRIARNKGL